ncbi:hypothetical protein BV210_08105 [Halorientalis sp. IM1011]|uniref:hypothetical protein n=1 Tax=Halorientalis sp. IM1011 TaxID=1932360 RepID=UPI00097CCCDB|nr:hypothetical protein [Halorientalis sp. IM1011]AQL42676.1 hypothetical protein BV210_08105 [Halorientalis sp. IM1011]
MPSLPDAVRSLSRRDLLAAGAGSLLTLGATSALGRPSLRFDGGAAYIHPASDRTIENGLQPDGDAETYVTVVADEAPDVAGPDIRPTFRELLETPETDEDGGVFHAIIQTRSTPESSYYLYPDSVRDPRWRGRDTLVIPVGVESVGPFDGIEDDDRRTQLQSAAELVGTAIWSVTPALNHLPSNVDLAQVHREYVE